MPSDDYRRTLRLQKLGRFLSLLLKHRSVRFPIQLDAEGYASFKDVMHILKRLPNFRWASVTDVKAVLDLPGPQRFELSGGQAKSMRIRAHHGHTSIRPQYEAVTPPDLLYYGTTSENLDAIRREGIRPLERQYVRLAADLSTARSIALRVTPDPIILHIDAVAAHAANYQFYNPTPGIYLTDSIPLRFIQEYKTG